MKGQAFLALAIVLGLATPALAGTIVCQAPDGDPTVEIAVAFSEMRGTGEVTGVRMQSANFALSSYPGETEFEPAIIAFADVSYDRISLGLESDASMRIILSVDIVRAAVYDSSGGPDTDVVVAGVANIGGNRTATLLCTGW